MNKFVWITTIFFYVCMYSVLKKSHDYTIIFWCLGFTFLGYILIGLNKYDYKDKDSEKPSSNNQPSTIEQTNDQRQPTRILDYKPSKCTENDTPDHNKVADHLKL